MQLAGLGHSQQRMVELECHNYVLHLCLHDSLPSLSSSPASSSLTSSSPSLSPLMRLSQVAVKGQTPIINGDFHKRVIVDDSFWTIEDGELGETA